METQIIDTLKFMTNDKATRIIATSRNSFIRNNNISFNKPISVTISENKQIQIDSYVDNNRRDIYLKKLINKGSFNDVFNFSYKKSDRYDPNYIIRISNATSTSDNIISELNGIKKQYKLCAKNHHIGQIIDYGKIYNPKKSIKYRLQEYSIQKKYGLSLAKILSNGPKYSNFNVVIEFMQNFLSAIESIHNAGFAHLDLKPDNILLKSRYTYGNGIFDTLDFVIVDFGAAGVFKTDRSKIVEEQMASAAFSPPELLQRKYGKKSDIWAYGVISYLVIVRKFFFKAKAQEIFLGEEKQQIFKNINKAIMNLYKNTIPKYVKSPSQITSYLHPLDNNNFYLLQDFIRDIFKLDINRRPNTRQLLSHPLFYIK